MLNLFCHPEDVLLCSDECKMKGQEQTLPILVKGKGESALVLWLGVKEKYKS